MLLVAGLTLAALAVAVGLFIPGRGTQADLVAPYGYPAKFLCGTYTLPWNSTVNVELRTAVNVHNPTADTVTIRKKAVQALTEFESPGQIGSFHSFAIPPDGAFEIDCADIEDLLALEPPAPAFLKGFVVIESPVELDVVGVYNAQRVVDGATPGVGHALDVDTVEARLLPPSPPPVGTSLSYAAKFVCGTAGSSAPLVPGDYFTYVNVHNPDDENGTLLGKKVVLALSELETPVAPTAWTGVELGVDGAFEVDCPDIYALLDIYPGTFIKGFVVLSSPTELDVVGVYGTTEEVALATAGGVGLSIDLEPVEAQVVATAP
jgi:hypothetical protein